MGRRDGERYLAGRFRFLRAQELMMWDDPSHAVQLSAQQLHAQGFRNLPVDLDRALRAEGSPWTAQALEIGSAAGFGRGCLFSIISESPLGFFLKRPIPPTLVVVAARTEPDGTCRLAIAPFPATKLSRDLITDDPDSASLAAPRVGAAIQAVIQHYQQSSTLLDQGKPQVFVKDAECPAAPNMAKKLTGWTYS